MLRKLALLVILGLAMAPAARADKPVRDEIKERVRAMRIARLIEALDLDEQGAARLMPVLNRAYDQIADVSKDSGEARRELRSLITAPKPDDARINKLVDRLLVNKTKVDALEAGMLNDVRKVLTPSQVARLVVVLPEINHQIQQQVRNAAKRGGGLPGSLKKGEEDPF